MAGAVACLAAWLAMLMWHATLAQLVGAAVCCTVGYGLLMPALYNLIAHASPMENASEAAGVNAVCLAAFMAVGSQLLFGLLGRQTVHDVAHGTLSYPAEAAFELAFAYLAAMCACCMVALLALGRRPAGDPVTQPALPAEAAR